MKIKILASGSKGNSALIRTNKVNILIDCGVTYQYLASGLNEVGLSPKDLDAILITHTHSDHIKGLATLATKVNLKIYILEEMYEEIKSKVPINNIYLYEKDLKLEDITINIFRTSHDVDGVGFIIDSNNKSIVYVTDTGYINSKTLKLLKDKDLYVIESNHDEKMLMEGPYPYILKQRVISDKGHLSNSTTANYLVDLVSNKTKLIILAHISENNNTEELALETVRNILKENNIEKDIILAKQYETLEEIEV